MLTLLTIIGTTAAAICAIAAVVTMRRTPKLPDPPYQPSVLSFEKVKMRGYGRDLPLHGVKARSRLPH
ncbi:hypothetical protein [Erythrobacter longus]|uniref:hypothetical protein n=1 Tax=Erythrobacter longus TaxID=1044 RepID=UPI00126866D5|nr:hypothetical protein [Erythrobacter longus]